jgi:hypothetical protein
MREKQPYATTMGQRMWPGQVPRMQLGNQNAPGIPGVDINSGGMMGMPGMGFNIGSALMPPQPPMMAQPDPSVAPEQESGGVLDKLKGLGSGIGGALSGAANWLTDKDQGYLRQMLLMNGIGAAASIYGANKQGAIADEERRAKERVKRSYGPRG